MLSHDIVGPKKVSEAFERWHCAQERLNAMINAMSQEPRIILPHEADADPNLLEEFQKFVISAYREWFQEIMVQMYALNKRNIAYIVYARWDIYRKHPIPEENDGNIYKALTVFDADMMVTMPEPEPCIVLAKARPNELILHPIPVDFVEKVEGATLLPAGLHD